MYDQYNTAQGGVSYISWLVKNILACYNRFSISSILMKKRVQIEESRKKGYTIA